MRPWTRLMIIGSMALAAVISAAPSAGAQYFGRNKVQHEEFAFEVLRTAHFDIYFYDEEREAAAEVGRMAERWNLRLSQLLRHDLRGRQPVIVYASPSDFQQTNVVAGEINEATGGVTEGLKRRVVFPLAGTLADTDHVLGHELVHAFQYDIADGTAMDQDGARSRTSLNTLPLWFIEGLAEYLSIGPVDPHTSMWVRDASRAETLPDVGKLNDPRYFPYRWGQALWAYVGGRWGDDVVPDLLREALRSGVDGAFTEVLGRSSEELSEDWHEAIHTHYAAALETGRRPAEYGRVVGRQARNDRALYGSPVLSPDGRRIIFFSERDLLSVDLYLADADTGRIIRRLVNTAVDPHFSSLQFIESAGAWRPDGGEFVIAVLRNGRPALALLDVETGRVRREISLPGLGEILNPAWSPDATSIAFSATAGGRSDLYVYDLNTDALRQVTSDAFADLQPAWSPDGRHIAFVTDRYSTDLPMLEAGAFGLALVELESASVRRLPTFERVKNMNPQWDRNGRTLYFLSDRNGITNIYALNVSTQDVRQVTNLSAGVSGVTALSPALSVAAEGNRLAFTAYDEGRLAAFVSDDPALLAGTPLLESTGPDAAALPPVQRASNELASLLGDAATGLPADPGGVEPYRRRLTLDWVGQPYVSAGISTFGPALGGGISFLWSDMLGDHAVGAAIDVNTFGRRIGDIYKDTGGVVQYQNLARRWDWGITAQQSPYVAGGFATGIGRSDGEPVLVDQEIIQRQISRGVGANVARPFNRVRRIEFGTAYQHVSFEESIRTRIASLRTGRLISEQDRTSSPVGSLGLVATSAAFVYDSSVFGATSPVAGQRSRLEVAPTFGNIAFTGALADYRRYFMPASFYTVAGRLLHYGRYGSGAEDRRLLPLVIGYPEFVRGYSVGSFEPNECSVTATSTCEEFDRLIGSRMLVANLELRFPLLRPFGITNAMYGPLPVEVGLFTDAGLAWFADDRPSVFGGSRSGVASAGVTLRVNLFGFAVGQLDLAHPFQRPQRQWVWSFSLNPGF